MLLHLVTRWHHSMKRLLVLKPTKCIESAVNAELVTRMPILFKAWRIVASVFLWDTLNLIRAREFHWPCPKSARDK